MSVHVCVHVYAKAGTLVHSLKYFICFPSEVFQDLDQMQDVWLSEGGLIYFGFLFFIFLATLQH